MNPLKSPSAIAAHTPGPWSASYNGNDDTRIFAESVADSPRCVAKVNAPLNRGLESVANARLIAAAPELLAEVKKAVEALEWAESLLQDRLLPDNLLTATLTQARAAIARARQS